MRVLRRFVATALASTVLASTAGLLAAAPAKAASLPPECTAIDSNDVQCAYSVATTGLNTTFVVPAGITTIGVFAVGGAGASVGNAAGGQRSEVFATLDVTPGASLTVRPAGDASGTTGGANGGGQGAAMNGASSGGGGGASAVLDAGGASLVVAAGGGGAGAAGGTSAGGRGGDAPQGTSGPGLGTPASNATPAQPGAAGAGTSAGGGGGAGTQAAGGAPGTDFTGTTTATGGTAMAGGNGSTAPLGGPGGGGGAGLDGGGGGGAGAAGLTGSGGGGGGADLVPADGYVITPLAGDTPQVDIYYSTFAITSPASLPDGQVGQPYAFQYMTNSDGPVTYSVASGALPAGLSLDPSTGDLSGTPGAAGAYSFTVEAVDQAGFGDEQADTLTIAAGPPPAPAATLNPTSLDFGSQPVGTTSAPKTVTLTNTGNATLHVSSVAIGPNPAPFHLASDTCTGAAVAAGGSCSVAVTFAPTAAGSATSSLSFSDDAGASPQVATLTGQGATLPAATVSPTALNFGGQPVGATSAAKTVTVSSTGSGPLTVSSVVIGGPNAADFAVTSDSCSGHTLAAGSSCTVTVTFTPSATGLRSASLAVADDASGSPQTVALSGQGQASADVGVTLSATPSNVKSGGTVTYKVTVSNSGPDTATTVQLTDAVPAGAQFAGMQAPAPWTCTTPALGSSGTITCTASGLAVGVTSTLTFTVKVTSSNRSTVSDTAQVTSAVSDPNPANNSATVSTPVQGNKG